MKKGIIMKLFLITAVMLAGLCQAAMPLGLAMTGTVFVETFDVTNLQGQIYTPARDFTYSTNAGCITVTGYIGTNSTVNTPPRINNYPVTVIDVQAFFYNQRIDTVYLPSGLTNISAGAFYGCSNLVNVTIPAAVLHIGANGMGPPAFFSCVRLFNLYFNGDAPTLGNNDFAGSVHTNYFLSGMTGFGTNFGGRPTAIWGPRVAASVIQNGTTNRPDQWGTVTLPSVTGASTNAPAWIAQTNTTLSITLTNDLERPQYLFCTGAVTVAFAGLRPPQPLYLVIRGPTSVTFGAGAHIVGGGNLQTNMSNHFVVWQYGTNTFINPVTTSED